MFALKTCLTILVKKNEEQVLVSVKAAEMWSLFLMTKMQLQKISTCKGKISFGFISQVMFWWRFIDFFSEVWLKYVYGF